MKSRDFCYWLQGYFEILEGSSERGSASLSSGQVEKVRKHLAMVFKHEIDPSMGPQKHQDELSYLHHGGGNDVLIKC